MTRLGVQPRVHAPTATISALCLLILLAGPAYAKPSERVPYIPQERGPWCAAATVAMVASAHGEKIGLRALVRQVPVSAEGIAWLDLALWAEAQGLTVRVTVMEPETLRATLAAGLPVIVAQRAGRTKHAIVVTAADGGRYTVLDPSAPGRRWLATEELHRLWAGGQAVVLWKDPPRDLPLAGWAAADRRYRALEWGLRAERLGVRDERALALYLRAVEADPSIPELRNNLALVLAALGRVEEARSELHAAARLAPTWPIPRQNLRALEDPAVSASQRTDAR